VQLVSTVGLVQLDCEGFVFSVKMPAALAGPASNASRAMAEVADTNDAFIKTPRSFRHYNAPPG
jgi:hypothetical protein